MHPCGASLTWRCGCPFWVGSAPSAKVASLPFPSRQQKVSALRACDALVLQHLPLADAIASAAAHRLFPLVERDDLLQVARESLVRSAPRCRTGEPAEPYLRAS
jgi:hypothetical protein